MNLIKLPIEEEVEITILIEVAEVVDDHMDSPLNSITSISFSKFNLILMELGGHKDQSIKSVERLVIQPLIITIG